MADNASTRLQHQIQTQLAQHGEYLVQPHSWLALLKGMDKARGHASKRSELVLAESQLKSPTPDLLRPDGRVICTIVHTGSLPSCVGPTPGAICTIIHFVAVAGLRLPQSAHACAIVHMVTIGQDAPGGALIRRTEIRLHCRSCI